MLELGKELTAASATPLLLSLLTEGESYGYALIRRVREVSDDTIHWTEGMLYPVLHRLERQELITAYWDRPAGRRRRRYYAITGAGEKELAAQKERWHTIQKTLNRLSGWAAECAGA